MKPTYKLSNWAVVSDPYKPPESGIQLHGSRDNGSTVTTSAIIDAKGRVVETLNSYHELIGDPNPAYLDYMSRVGHKYDPARPICIRRVDRA